MKFQQFFNMIICISVTGLWVAVMGILVSYTKRKGKGDE